MPSQLALFDLQPTQTAVQNIHLRKFGQSVKLTEQVRSHMCVKVRIKHKDGTSLAATDHVGPINLLLQSLFSEVDVGLQGKVITSTTGHYNYKAMLQHLLKDGNEAKMSQLTSQMWIKDTTDKLDDVDVNAGLNKSLHARAKYFSLSKLVDLEGPICHDIFNIDRYMLNQIRITLTFL